MYTNKTYLVVLSIIFSIVISGSVPVENIFKENISHNKILDPCPSSAETNYTIMEEFLTISEWESARQETNTNHLSTSQISLLQSPEYDDTCEILNNQYQEAITASWADDGVTYEKYNVSYYKAGNYFFVVISLRQHSDYVSSGVAYLDVYDDNLNLIKGYAF